MRAQQSLWRVLAALMLWCGHWPRLPPGSSTVATTQALNPTVMLHQGSVAVQRWEAFIAPGQLPYLAAAIAIPLDAHSIRLSGCGK